jgi:hypothetical protein
MNCSPLGGVIGMSVLNIAAIQCKAQSLLGIDKMLNVRNVPVFV